MNTGPETGNSQIEDHIDRTLRMIGSADPRPGIEKRIEARLADASLQTGTYTFGRIFGLPRLALVSAAGMAACVVIIAGSVNHSRRVIPVAPGIRLPMSGSAGMGSASGEKAAPKPVAAPAHGRARAVHKAETSPDAQKRDGLTVPKTPLLRPQN
jgi:hypothetical protein